VVLTKAAQASDLPARARLLGSTFELSNSFFTVYGTSTGIVALYDVATATNHTFAPSLAYYNSDGLHSTKKRRRKKKKEEGERRAQFCLGAKRQVVSRSFDSNFFLLLLFLFFLSCSGQAMMPTASR
jgi:hypothetical protein